MSYDMPTVTRFAINLYLATTLATGNWYPATGIRIRLLVSGNWYPATGIRQLVTRFGRRQLLLPYL
jgi:hypothetical protein